MFQTVGGRGGGRGDGGGRGGGRGDGGGRGGGRGDGGGRGGGRGDGGGRGGGRGGGGGRGDGGGRGGGRGDGGGRGGGRGDRQEVSLQNPQIITNMFSLRPSETLSLFEYGLEFTFPEGSQLPARLLQRPAFCSMVVSAFMASLGSSRPLYRWCFDHTLLSLDVLPIGTDPIHVTLPPRKNAKEGDAPDVCIIQCPSPPPAEGTPFKQLKKDVQLLYLNKISHLAFQYTQYPRYSVIGKYMTEKAELSPNLKRAHPGAVILRGFIFSVVQTKVGFAALHEVRHSVFMTDDVEALSKNPDYDLHEAKVVPVYDDQTTYTVGGMLSQPLDVPMGPDTRQTFREYYETKFSMPTTRKLKPIYDKCLSYINSVQRGAAVIFLKAEKPPSTKQAQSNTPEQKFLMVAKLMRLVDPMPKSLRAELPRICGMQASERTRYCQSLPEHLRAKCPGPDAPSLFPELPLSANSPADSAGKCPEDVFKEWGITISEKAVQAKLLCLDTKIAKVKMGDAAKAGEVRGDSFSVRNARAEIAYEPRKLPHPVVVIHNGHKDVVQMVKDIWFQLVRTAKQMNLQDFPGYDSVELIDVVRPDDAKKKILNRKIGFAFIATSGHDKQCNYNYVKALLNGRDPVCCSQGFRLETYKKLNPNIICDALIKQTRAKLDNAVYRPRFSMDGLVSNPLPLELSSPNKNAGVLVIGFDVTHKSVIPAGALRGLKPSLAAICAFMLYEDGTVGTFDSLKLHAVREEVSPLQLRFFGEFVENCLAKVKKNPHHILVLRDGTSASQIPAVKAEEVKQIEDVLKNKGLTDTCKLSFLLATKRIKQCLTAFEADAKLPLSHRDNIQSLPYATIINDEQVVADPKNEFYMTNLDPKFCPSTVRLVHYHAVVLGAPNNKKGELLKGIQYLILALASCYPNWQGPVLLPAPLHYAHIAARRADEVYTETGAYREQSHYQTNGFKLCPFSPGLRWL